MQIKSCIYLLRIKLDKRTSLFSVNLIAESFQISIGAKKIQITREIQIEI